MVMNMNKVAMARKQNTAMAKRQAIIQHEKHSKNVGSNATTTVTARTRVETLTGSAYTTEQNSNRQSAAPSMRSSRKPAIKPGVRNKNQKPFAQRAAFK